MNDNVIKRDIMPTSIKFERELYEKIKIDAEKNERSFSKQVQFMLKKYYDLKEM